MGCGPEIKVPFVDCLVRESSVRIKSSPTPSSPQFLALLLPSVHGIAPVPVLDEEEKNEFCRKSAKKIKLTSQETWTSE